MAKVQQLFIPGLEPEKKELDEAFKKYSLKIKTPVYEPKNKKPHLLELINTIKRNELVDKIEKSSVSEDEKKFLVEAAQRHIVFQFDAIADYYAYASKEMQELMEDSALVIIDFEKAIELGYVRLVTDLADQFLEDENNG